MTERQEEDAFAEYLNDQAEKVESEHGVELEDSCVIPSEEAVQDFKTKIKRAIMMYLGDCEDTETVPTVYGFDGFVKYLELSQGIADDLLNKVLYKEDEFAL